MIRVPKKRFTTTADAAVEPSSRSDIATLQPQLQDQRRTVDFDTFDFAVQQLISMVNERTINIAPDYQRHFRWGDDRCSQLVESVFLGIPIPSLFMATNQDATWELVDGVQRLGAIIRFAGSDDVRAHIDNKPPLRLVGLQKLTDFENYTFADLPRTLQLHFMTRPLKVITLSDKSDGVVRFDLFERLNRGGVLLSAQEIRNCVYRGPFADFLEEMAKDQNFRTVVRLNQRQQHDGTAEECVLRFFSFLDRYKKFVHIVNEFLNHYMQEASKSFDRKSLEKIFRETFLQLAGKVPDGIVRPTKKGATPLNLYEGVAVGAALAIKKTGKLQGSQKEIQQWLGEEPLRSYTIGATNSPAAVTGRIEFCRDKFLGK